VSHLKIGQEAKQEASRVADPALAGGEGVMGVEEPSPHPSLAGGAKKRP